MDQTIEVHGPKISFRIPIFGGINVTETVIIEWIVMIIIMGVCLYLTTGLSKTKPKKRQIIAEMAVKTINNLVEENMGKRNMKYAPYLASLFLFILIGSLISLTGLRSMTADINVTMTLALITFALITIHKFKANGFFGYFKSYTQPVPVFTPINIISDFATPISMGFRLFGNMAGGMIISMLIYYGLGAITSVIGFPIPIFKVGIPAILSIYFDLFVSTIQAFVFIMLTMTYVSSADE